MDDRNQEDIGHFLNSLAAERGLSANTREAYHRDLKLCAAWLIKKKTTLRAASTQQLAAYFASVPLQKQARSSVARLMASLNQFYRFALSEQWRADHPLLSLSRPKLPKTLPKTLSEDDVVRLFDVIASWSGVEGARLRLILELLYGAGLRVSEAVALPRTAIDIKNAIVRVRGKGAKERVLPLGEMAQTAYQDYIPFASEGAFLFPSAAKEGHLTRQRLFQLIKQVAVQANIDPTCLSPHVLRHAFATHLLDRGADILTVRDLLGHSNVTTTEIYTHVSTVKLAKTLEKHHPLGNQNKRR